MTRLPRFFGALALLIATTPAFAGPPQGASPYTPPAAFQDVGAPSVCPFILVVAGQSNAVGFDSGGSKAIGSNIWITNDRSNPTAVIPAAFGTAPLNVSVANNYNTANGVSNQTAVSAALAYNNQGVAFANSLRASGLIPATRPIVIVPDFQGGVSITHWVDSPNTSLMATNAPNDTTVALNFDIWARLTTQLAVAEADSAHVPAGVICPINHVIWDQGENDTNGTGSVYASQAAYAAAFATLVSKFQALPQWSPTTTMSVTEIGMWASNTSFARNDVLHMLRSGAKYPFVTMVGATGAIESTDSPGLHYDGATLIALGARHFAAWRSGFLARQFSGDVTKIGSSLAFPNVLVFTSAGGTITNDDAQTGAIVLGAGGTIVLPRPIVGMPPLIVKMTTATYLAAPTGYNIQAPHTRNTVGSYRPSSYGTVIATPIPSQNIWQVSEIGLMRTGDQGRDTGTGSVYTGTVTFDVTQTFSVDYTFSGATVTLNYTLGTDAIMRGSSTGTASTLSFSPGSVTLPNGSTATTLTLQPGQTLHLNAGVPASGSFTLYATYENGQTGRPLAQFTVSTLPACAAATKGNLAAVTDATSPAYNSALTGGGSSAVPVFCNGTSWTAH